GTTFAERRAKRPRKARIELPGRGIHDMRLGDERIHVRWTRSSVDELLTQLPNRGWGRGWGKWSHLDHHVLERERERSIRQIHGHELEEATIVGGVAQHGRAQARHRRTDRRS